MKYLKSQIYLFIKKRT